jgi:aspartate carbamoyltransferase regulatory subunit
MKIDSIQSGIVLDHIKAGKSMQIYEYLGLDDLDCRAQRRLKKYLKMRFLYLSRRQALKNLKKE